MRSGLEKAGIYLAPGTFPSDGPSQYAAMLLVVVVMVRCEAGDG